MDREAHAGRKDRLVAVRMPESLYESLSRLAAKEHRNLSQMARMLVESGIAQHERQLALNERDREWTAFWHAAITEADDDAAAGRVSRHDDIESLFASLDDTVVEHSRT